MKNCVGSFSSNVEDNIDKTRNLVLIVEKSTRLLVRLVGSLGLNEFLG